MKTNSGWVRKRPGQNHQGDGAEHHQPLHPAGDALERLGAGVHPLVGGDAEAEQRDHRQEGDYRQVLEEQDREARSPALGAGELLLGQRLHHDRGRGEAEHDPYRQRLVPGQAERQADRADREQRQPNLQPAEAEQPVPHAPERLRLHLEPDQEQHQDHAELGVVLHVLGLGAHQPEHRADGEAGGEIAQHRPEAEPLAERHRDHRRRQVDRHLKKNVLHRRSSPAADPSAPARSGASDGEHSANTGFPFPVAGITLRLHELLRARRGGRLRGRRAAAVGAGDRGAAGALSRRPEPGAAGGGGGARRAGAGARRRRHRQDPGADHPHRAPAQHRAGAAEPDPRGHLHQQGGARDEGAGRRAGRRRRSRACPGSAPSTPSASSSCAATPSSSG